MLALSRQLQMLEEDIEVLRMELLSKAEELKARAGAYEASEQPAPLFSGRQELRLSIESRLRELAVLEADYYAYQREYSAQAIVRGVRNFGKISDSDGDYGTVARKLLSGDRTFKRHLMKSVRDIEYALDDEARAYASAVEGLKRRRERRLRRAAAAGAGLVVLAAAAAWLARRFAGRRAA